jgi:colicin import membrane protein
MPTFWRENSWALAGSALLHGLLIAALLFSAYYSSTQRMPALQPLPIDAVVVNSQVVHAAQQEKAERAAQELAQQRAAAEARAATDAEAEAAERAKSQAAAQAKAAESQAAEDARRLAEAQKIEESNQAIAEAKKAEQARAAAAAKEAVERQAEEAKQAAAKQAADAKRAADERAKQDREAELRRQLADEEHVSAVQSGPLRDRYITLLRNKIQSAWIKPPSATAGVDCMVEVTQVPGGEVTGARVTQCNGDAAVRQSIENAVYRASPLPDPPDPALFERNLVLRFRPNE